MESSVLLISLFYGSLNSSALDIFLLN